jgi:hypothetical protein
MKTINYPPKTRTDGETVRESPVSGALARATEEASKKRAELLNAIKGVRSGLAREIEESDAIDHEYLNRRSAALTQELISLNRECDRILREYAEALPDVAETGTSANVQVHINQIDHIDDETLPPPQAGDHHKHSSRATAAKLNERLELAMNRRQEIASEIQEIKDQRDAPLFVRMHGASKLIKGGFDRLAAGLLLDLICSGFYGLEQVMSSEGDTVEFCLRRVSALHGTAWLERLIETHPKEVESYKRLQEVLKESS